jgi:hypothetical protein
VAKVDFAAGRKAAEASGAISGGDYYKFKEGDNRIRLMTECLPHQGEYKGTKNFKWLCYVLDRRDGKIKTFFMPHTVYKSIEALQVSDDYAFVEVPMPYDITIHAKKAGTKEVEYSLIPARRETPLTDDELAELDGMKPIKDVQKALKEKQVKGEASGDPNEPPPHEDDDLRVPF